MTEKPAAGWHPDPEDPAQLRYWDGNAWTEHRHPVAPPTSPLGVSGGPGPVAPRTTRPWYKKKRFVIPGAVLGLAVIGNALPDGDDTVSAVNQPVATVTVSAAPPTSATSSAVAQPVAKPTTTKAAAPAPAPAKQAPKVQTGEYGAQPAEQRKVLASVAAGQKALESSDNELQQGAALRARSKSMCAALDGRTIKGWTGKILELGANGEGKGVLRIAITDDVEIKTWNNAFSDIGSDTLIEPDSALFGKVLKLQEGQVVSFSGSFLPGDEGECVNEGSLSLRGKLGTPDFIFKFSDVRPL